MSQDHPATTIHKWLSPHLSALPTVACMIGNLLGIFLNLQMPYLGLGENVFGFIVLVSMTLIAIGFLPGLKKWRYGRLATNVSCVAVGCFMIYVLWTVGTYKET